MGGKHKQAQRTKHNVKPSSSGRSAELLGTSLMQSGTLASVKEAGFILPGLTVANDIDACLDANFQLIFKKMNKKDSTTKLKAIQQYTDLVTESDPEAVKTVLSIWSRLYTVLATDAEHHVREATQNAHRQVVLKVKRNLAPYLKQLMGTWFTSQFDTYAPAATAATQAFQDAFPPNKLQEVLVFCQTEVLSYIFDNIAMQVIQNTSQSKSNLNEDSQARHERLLISSLQGYCSYLDTVSEEHIRKVYDINIKIVRNNKFWKLAKHKVVPVRAAWFAAISMLTQKAFFLLEDEKNHLCSTVFGSLDDTEPSVLPYVWETVLIIMTSLNEWWTVINFEKYILPKLWRVLKEGGKGNASIIYPNILPFISKLPSSVDINVFYTIFFENLLIGLRQKNVMASKQESTAISSTIIECMKYVILKNCSNISFCEDIIKSHLIALVKWCLSEDQINHKIVFNQVASLLHYWCQICVRNDGDSYTNYLKLTWNALSETFLEVLHCFRPHKSDTLSNIAAKQIDFLQGLKQATKLKKRFKVTFSDELTHESNEIESDTADSHVYNSSCNEFAFKLCESYITLINGKDYHCLLEPLSVLIREYDSEELFNYLNNQLKIQSDNDESTSLLQIILEKWLNQSNLDYQSVIDLIFHLFKYLNDREKEEVVRKFSLISKPESLAWCIKNSLSYPHNKDCVLKKWVCSEQVTEFLEKSVDKLMEDRSSEISMLLKLVFNEDEGGELLVAKETVCRIISKLKLPLMEPYKFPATLDICASLASYITTVIYSESILLTYGNELLLALFHLSCQNDIKTDVLSQDTLWEVNTAWQDAFCVLAKCLPSADLKNILATLADIIEEKVLRSESEQECVIVALEKLLSIIVENSKLNLQEVLRIFFDRKFTQASKNYLTSVCLLAEYVRGNTCAPYENIFDENIETNEDVNIQKYFIWSFLKVRALSALIVNQNEEDDDHETDTEGGSEQEKVDSQGYSMIDSLNTLKCSDHFQDFLDFLLSTLYDFTLSCLFSENYKNTKYFKNVKSSRDLLKDKICEVITKTKIPHLVLIDILCDKLEENHWIWYKSLYLLFSEIQPKDLTTLYNIALSKLSKNNKLGLIYLTKIFGRHVSFNQLKSEHETIELIFVLKNLRSFEGAESQIAEIFSKIEGAQSKSVDFPLMKWKDMQEVIESFRFCAALFKDGFENLQRENWDITVISLTTWLENVAKNKASYKKLEVQALIAAMADLFVSIENYIRNLKEDNPHHNFINEWEDVFLKDIHTNILLLWIFLAEQFKAEGIEKVFPFLSLLEEFGTVISKCNYTDIFDNTNAHLPDWSKFRDYCFELLKNSNVTLQLWGYKMLLLQVPGLVNLDSKAVLLYNRPHEKGLTFRQFEEVLVFIEDIVSAMLSEFKLGEDSCQVQEFTDSFTYTLAYLLLWDVLLAICEKSSTELNYQYADWLKETNLLKNALNNLFRLMPTEVVRHADSKQNSFMDIFTTRAPLDIKESCSNKELEHMVCWVYASALSQLPALVRQWWSSIEVRAAQIVEKITAVYVSPSLISQELSAVVDHERSFKNMVVKIAPVAREVIAVYTVDEAQMELVIKLPANYPLGSPNVQCSKQIGGTSFRQWLMQLKKCLLHQNGRIWDGLALWNKNLNKKFDGVEECYICFGVLHAGTCQLPKLSCQTCKKKFHSACLYKWFSTSNKSSCPICRNLF